MSLCRDLLNKRGLYSLNNGHRHQTFLTQQARLKKMLMYGLYQRMRCMHGMHRLVPSSWFKSLSKKTVTVHERARVTWPSWFCGYVIHPLVMYWMPACKFTRKSHWLIWRLNNWKRTKTLYTCYTFQNHIAYMCKQ